jgi:hypothetical protein
VASEKMSTEEQRKYTKLSNTTFKADSFDILNWGAKISFFSTIKTGEGFDYASQKNPNARLSRFTASLSSSNLDFSKINEHVESEVYARDSKELTALFQYVLRNGVAFNAASHISNFQYMIAAYFAWLKILIEIIGNPYSQYTVPIALKMFKDIYNTADIIRLFIGISPLDILNSKFINMTELKNHFINLNYGRPIIEEDSKKRKNVATGKSNILYKAKAEIISNELLKKDENGNVDNSDVTYEHLYERMLETLNNELKEVALLRLPSLNIRISILTKNIAKFDYFTLKT